MVTRKAKQKRFIVRINQHTTFSVNASSPALAKQQVWETIRNGYIYGFKGRADFIKGTTVEK